MGKAIFCLPSLESVFQSVNLHASGSCCSRVSDSRVNLCCGLELTRDDKKSRNLMISFVPVACSGDFHRWHPKTFRSGHVDSHHKPNGGAEPGTFFPMPSTTILSTCQCRSEVEWNVLTPPNNISLMGEEYYSGHAWPLKILAPVEKLDNSVPSLWGPIHACY